MSAQVMVVEDDEEIRETMADILEFHGYVPLLARNGHEALSQLAEGARPALILLDLMMPVMDGRAFRTEQLKDARIAAIPVIVVSAFRDLSEAVRELGPAGVLHKPVELSELLRVVEHFTTAV